MSGGRRVRRRIVQHAGAVELDHRTRQLIAELRRAHDDPAVSIVEFLPIADRAGRHQLTLPKSERLEMAGLIFEIATRKRVVGWAETA